MMIEFFLKALEAGEKAIQEGRTQSFTRDMFNTTVKNGIAKAKNRKEDVAPDVPLQ